MYHTYPVLAMTAFYIVFPQKTADFIFNTAMSTLSMKDGQDFVLMDVVPKVNLFSELNKMNMLLFISAKEMFGKSEALRREAAQYEIRCFGSFY